ncbi:MAG: GDP-mannose 4,6-dehydratase [Gemmataceae bacterium]
MHRHPALTYGHTYKMPVCVTRCGNFYGGGDLNFNRIVPGTVRSVVRGERPVIRSDGSFIRDYFYVKDGALAYLHLAECLAASRSLAGHAFNFSTEIQVTVLELVEKILKEMDSKLEPEVLGIASNEIKHQYLSAEKARAMLDWKPQYGLEGAAARDDPVVRRLLRGHTQQAGSQEPPDRLDGVHPRGRAGRLAGRPSLRSAQGAAVPKVTLAVSPGAEADDAELLDLTAALDPLLGADAEHLHLAGRQRRRPVDALGTALLHLVLRPTPQPGRHLELDRARGGRGR